MSQPNMVTVTRQGEVYVGHFEVLDGFLYVNCGPLHDSCRESDYSQRTLARCVLGQMIDRASEAEMARCPRE